jgi:hypothetical protein
VRLLALLPAAILLQQLQLVQQLVLGCPRASIPAALLQCGTELSQCSDAPDALNESFKMMAKG